MNIGKRIHVSNSTSAGCRVAIALLSVAFLAGCAGGGGGGGGVITPPGIPKIDLHGDSPGFATLVVADGPKIHGAFNDHFDVDWFKFRGVEGVAYTLQLTGHSAPAPDWGNPFSGMLVSVFKVDAGTQQANSTGTDGGTPRDIDPILQEADDEDIGFFGDSRITFRADATTVYYFRLESGFTSLGNYVIKLATSQGGFNSHDPHNLFFSPLNYTLQSRLVSLVDPDDGWTVFNGIVRGGVDDVQLQIGGGGAIREIFTLVLVDEVTLFADEPDPDTGIQPLNDDPETPVAHIHWGIPHANYPELRFDLTPGDDHPFAVDFFDDAKAGGNLREPGVFESPLKINGKETGLTKTVTKNGVVTMEDGREMLSFEIRISRDPTDGSKELDDAVADEAWRLIIGFEWFVDIHYTDDLDLDSEPVATSDASGGAYNIFETDLIMSPLSVVPPPLFPRTPFRLNFDAALQTFQIAYQQYDQVPTDFYDPFGDLGASRPLPLSPTLADQYAGGVIDIHRGGPGVNGPVILELGRVPRSIPPPPYHSPQRLFDPFTFAPIPGHPPGQKHVVKRLSDSEMSLLRNEYYFGNGIYVDVHTEDNPLGAVRSNIFFDMALDGNLLFNKSSAESQGTVTFVSSYADGGNITVVANGEIRGTIDRATSGALECGGGEDGEAVSMALMPETYYYRATADDGTEWDGLVTVSEGSCETITLSVE